MPPESYKIRIVLDKDSSQSWTPGSLNPYRMPERVINSTETIKIKENWSLEQHEIRVSLSGRSSSKSGADSTKTVDPGNKDNSPRPGRRNRYV